MSWRRSSGAGGVVRSRPLRAVLFAALGGMAALPFSGDAAAHPRPALAKLGRGIAGVTLGVFEVPGAMVEETRLHGVGSGASVGFAKGLGRFVTRELVGIGQILTAPFDAPAGLETALSGAYPWSAFSSAHDAAAEELARAEKELRWVRGAEVERHDGALRVRFPGELLFRPGASTLAREAQPPLQGVAETLARHPRLRLEVQGHTDATGSAPSNQRLSEARAAAVREYLVAKGVEAERIDAAGFGDSQPVASNASADGRRRNRRVEIVVRAVREN